jgi:hypothetical protein
MGLFYLASNVIDSVLDVPLCVAEGTFYLAFALLDLPFYLLGLASGLLVRIACRSSGFFLYITGHFFCFALQFVA